MLQFFTKTPLPARIAILSTAILLVSTCIVAANSLYTVQDQVFQQHEVKALPGATRPQARKVDYRRLENFHLFGKAAKPSVDSLAKKIIKAPETRLNLQLLGVVFDRDTKSGLAIIKAPGVPQKPYRKGDKLPGNAHLFAIENRRIILERNNRHEVLTLKKFNLQSQKTSPDNGKEVISRQAPPSPTPLPVKQPGKFM
jgi:type II secretion system protein C